MGSPLTPQGQVDMLKLAAEITKAAAGSGESHWGVKTLVELLEKSYEKLLELSEKHVGK